MDSFLNSQIELRKKGKYSYNIEDIVLKKKEFYNVRKKYKFFRLF